MERGDDTRGRILDAAWQLAAERGSAEIPVGDIAKAAGVTRQLVYFHFTNRAGVLAAMARRHDHAHGFRKAVGRTRERPPVEALAELIAAWLDYIPAIRPVARALEVAQVRGEDGGAAWADRMAELRLAFRLAVERVAEEGRLRDGWTVERAAEWAWSRCHIDAWHQLVVDCGWPPEEFAERTVRSIIDELVADATRGAARRRSRSR